MEQTQQNKPLSSEEFNKLLEEQLNAAYRRGYNAACDVLSEVLLSHSGKFGDPKIKTVVENLALTFKKCHLKEEWTNGTNNKAKE